MSESWMGPLGLLLALSGAIGLVLGQIKMAGVLARLDEPLSRAADAKLGRLNHAAWVIAAAVFFYLELRSVGHGRFGLLVCTVVLLINAIVVAILRVRWLSDLHPPRDIAAGHAVWVGVQTIGVCSCFVGVRDLSFAVTDAKSRVFTADR